MKNNNNFYDNKVVYKPWGYEYIIFRNSNRLAITFVKINYKHKTSLHCHPRKKTGFIILSGEALVQLGCERVGECRHRRTKKNRFEILLQFRRKRN